MKFVRIILFVLCLLQILFPFFDYFLFQWRNDSRFSLISSLSMEYYIDSGVILYPVDFTPNSFSEYVIYNYDLSIRSGINYMSRGIQADVFIFVMTVNNYLSGGYVMKGLSDVYSSCILVCRSVSLFLAYGFLYIISLPVFFCYDIFVGGKKREKF